MSEKGQKKREYLFDVQSPLPQVSVNNLSLAQRKIFDNMAKVVVGTTLAWVSTMELLTDLRLFGKHQHGRRNTAGQHD